MEELTVLRRRLWVHRKDGELRAGAAQERRGPLEWELFFPESQKRRSVCVQVNCRAVASLRRADPRSSSHV